MYKDLVLDRCALIVKCVVKKVWRSCCVIVKSNPFEKTARPYINSSCVVSEILRSNNLVAD